MGVDDRDGWRNAQREREAEVPSPPGRFGRAADRARADRADAHGIPPALRWGPLAIVVFWLVVMAVVYGGIKLVMQPRQITITMAGEMTIPRARDGHFYAPGTVAGQPVVFLVDTGASYVTVSEAFARHAGIGDGTPTRFHTANGTIEGRIVPDVPVSLGPATVSGVKVAVGLNGIGRDQALLGQSFLSRFQITLKGDEMVLRRP